MPYINVRMIDDGESQAQKDAIIEGITRVFVDVLGRPATSVWVVIDPIEKDNWGIGGLNTTARRAQAATPPAS
jgi:4-oxalocrotonate tautomerase